jgi:hypothetical protein
MRCSKIKSLAIFSVLPTLLMLTFSAKSYALSQCEPNNDECASMFISDMNQYTDVRATHACEFVPTHGNFFSYSYHGQSRMRSSQDNIEENCAAEMEEALEKDIPNIRVHHACEFVPGSGYCYDFLVNTAPQNPPSASKTTLKPKNNKNDPTLVQAVKAINSANSLSNDCVLSGNWKTQLTDQYYNLFGSSDGFNKGGSFRVVMIKRASPRSDVPGQQNEGPADDQYWLESSDGKVFPVNGDWLAPSSVAALKSAVCDKNSPKEAAQITQKHLVDQQGYSSDGGKSWSGPVDK